MMRRYIAAIILLLLALTSWSAGLRLAADRQLASIVIGFSGAPVAGTQLFFARAHDFSERDSLIVDPEKPSWQMKAPADRVDTLRIDPPPGVAVSICSMDIAFGDGRIRSLKDYRVSGFHQIADIRQDGACLSLLPIAGSDDPQVTFALSSPVSASSSWTLPSVLAVFGGFSFLIAALLMRPRAQGEARSSLAELVGARLVAIYILMSLLAGFAYAVITPPGAVTDEYAHVTKAVKVSSGVMVGDTGARAFPNIFEMYGVFNGYLDPGVQFSASQLAAQISTPVPCTPATAALPHGADSYAPHLYLAPAASYSISCAAGLDTGTFLLLARIGNLLLATALIAIGIWATRRARWALFVCALLPMTMYQVASVSADALYIALSFAWIGAVCGVIEGRISIDKSMRLLVPLALALAVSKPGAAWVLGAILFARPVYVSRSGTFVPAFLTLLVLPFVIHLLWVLHAAGSASPLDGVDPAVNLARLRSEPLQVASVFAHTFVGPHGLWLGKSSLGLLGWLDVYLSGWSYIGLALCLLASVWMGMDRDRPSAWVSGIAVVFSAGATLMLALPLFIFWTFEQSAVVMGLQGRYFLPCIAFAVCFLARGAPARVRACFTIFIPLVLAFALADGLLALIARYYP